MSPLSHSDERHPKGIDLENLTSEASYRIVSELVMLTLSPEVHGVWVLQNQQTVCARPGCFVSFFHSLITYFNNKIPVSLHIEASIRYHLLNVCLLCL